MSHTSSWQCGNLLHSINFIAVHPTEYDLNCHRKIWNWLPFVLSVIYALASTISTYIQDSGKHMILRLTRKRFISFLSLTFWKFWQCFYDHLTSYFKKWRLNFANKTWSFRVFTEWRSQMINKLARSVPSELSGLRWQGSPYAPASDLRPSDKRFLPRRCNDEKAMMIWLRYFSQEMGAPFL